MSTNSIIAQMNALSFDDEQKKQRGKYKADMQADIDADGAAWDSQINSTQKYYDKQIDDKEAEYATDYQKNAVQKLINEKQIAERNANLGLTDSGLNRTQQTAAQLSYANQKGKIDLARQSALDNLTLAMTDAITTLQNQKAASAMNITNQWNNYADTQAQNIYNTKYNGYVDMYNAQAEADAAVQKAAIEASNKTSKKILWYRTGTYDDNGNPIFRNSEGKTQAFGAGVNPYTGTKNPDAKYGTFGGAEGYQPTHIVVKDEKGKDKAIKLNNTGETTDITGKTQTIWEADGKRWLWRGDLNRYVELEITDD